ncbi:MAG: hypothetical protein QXU20_02150 [Candidatus Woesearchaeota archaeon]
MQNHNNKWNNGTKKNNEHHEKSINEILGELSYLMCFHSKQNFGFSENLLKNQERETLEKLLEVFPEKINYATNDDSLILGFAFSATKPEETIDFFTKIYDICKDKNRNMNDAKSEIKKLAENYARNSLENIKRETNITTTEDFDNFYIRTFSTFDFYKVIQENKDKNQNKKKKELLVKDLYDRLNENYKEHIEVRKNEKDNYIRLAKNSGRKILISTQDFENFINKLKEYYDYKNKAPSKEELEDSLYTAYEITEEPISGEGAATIRVEFLPKEEQHLKIILQYNTKYEKEEELVQELNYYKQKILYQFGLIEKEPELPKHYREIIEGLNLKLHLNYNNNIDK